MTPRKFYELQARELLKSVREKKEISYAHLSDLLRAHGESIEPQVLINKINRGKFSMQFALQCLAVMDIHGLTNLPNYFDYKRRVEKSIMTTKKAAKAKKAL